MSLSRYVTDPKFEQSVYYQPKPKAPSQKTGKCSGDSESNRSDRRKTAVTRQSIQPSTQSDSGAKLARKERYVHARIHIFSRAPGSARDLDYLVVTLVQVRNLCRCSCAYQYQT